MNEPCKLNTEVEQMPKSLRCLAELALASAVDGYSGLETIRTSYHSHDGIRDKIVDAWITYSTPRLSGDKELARPPTAVLDHAINDLIAADESLRQGNEGVFSIPTSAGISVAKFRIDLSRLAITLTLDESLTEEVAGETLTVFLNQESENVG